MKKQMLFISVLFSLILVMIIPSVSVSKVMMAKGQTVYVPVYSHIYTGQKGRPFNLTSTLSIRNTDPDQSIQIDSVDFYDSDGTMIKHFIKKPETLKAVATKRFIIPEFDSSGGSGANFLVSWKSVTGKSVNPPIIESIMIGTQNQQGVSFLSRGQVIRELP